MAEEQAVARWNLGARVVVGPCYCCRAHHRSVDTLGCNRKEHLQ
jgi:hypothetical protein